MKRGITGVLLVGVLALVAATCGGDDNQNVGETTPQPSEVNGTPMNEVGNTDVGGPVLGGGDRVEGTRWMARSVKGEDVLPQFPPLTLLFDATGGVGGSAGCNQYAGTYKVEGSKITITVGLATRLSCLELQGKQEGRFLETLQEAAEFDINGDELTLSDADGTPLAFFEAA